MQSKRLSLLMTSAVVLAASAALADSGPLSPGALEYSTSVAFNRSTFTPSEATTTTSVTHLTAAAGVGRSMNEHWALGGALLLHHRAVGGEGQNGLGGSIGAGYNFTQQGNLIPFISGGIGALRYSNQGDADRSLLLPMLRVGFRSMIGATRSLNASIGFQRESNRQGTVAGSANEFDVGIGYSMFPR